MALLGLGVGMSMQNLVLAVQNTVDLRSIGAATSVVTFFRSMGGAAGVSVLGSIAANRVSDRVAQGLVAMGLPAPQGGGSESLDLAGLPAPVQDLVRGVYGDVIGDVFVIAAIISAVAVLAVLFIREVPLRRSNAPAAETPPATRPVPLPAAANGTVAGNGAGAAAGNGHVADGRMVLGRVLLGDGRPLAGASVTLTDTTGRQVDRASSGADGGYRLRPAASGTFLLIASAPHLAPDAEMVAVAESPVHRDVVLSGSGGLRGTVSDGHGAPLPGALVTLTDGSGQVVASTATDSAGSFALGELLPGSYTLTGRAPGHQPVAVPVELADGQTGVRDLVLVGGARVTGVVRAASDQRPLPEATVTLLDSQGNVLASTHTGLTGRYAFEDLQPGSYTLTATGFAPVATALRVPAGTEVAHDVTLGAVRG
jgi:hypothetical protein